MDRGNETVVIWFNDLTGFISPEHLASFFPVAGMSLAEQLNALLRFSIYFAIILFIIGRTSAVFFLPLLVAIGTFFMYTAASSDPVHTRQQSEARLKEPLLQDKPKPASTPHPHCTQPTRDNPFMNVMPSDYVANPRRPAACDISDPAIAASVERLHDSAGYGLPRDGEDIFHRSATSRQFVTNPITTIPNDQTTFARWLYGQGPRIKRNNSRHHQRP